jgi:hypothetical protein
MHFPNTSNIASFLRHFDDIFCRFFADLPMITDKGARKKIRNFFGEKPLALPCRFFGRFVTAL